MCIRDSNHADIVLVQQADGLAEPELQVIGQTAHVVVGLHAVGLEDVGVDGALSEDCLLYTSHLMRSRTSRSTLAARPAASANA